MTGEVPLRPASTFWLPRAFPGLKQKADPVTACGEEELIHSRLFVPEGQSTKGFGDTSSSECLVHKVCSLGQTSHLGLWWSPLDDLHSQNTMLLPQSLCSHKASIVLRSNKDKGSLFGCCPKALAAQSTSN